jgi:hypothetical protein
MAVKWERLAGDTSKFAFKLSFSDDPDNGAGATAEDSQAWGSFQIWVEERNLTAHYFRGELVESVHWYLLPLLEWFTSNWDAIFHEERLPNQNSAPTAEDALQRNAEPPRALNDAAAVQWEERWFEWWSRHSLEAAREGGIFPSACFRRWRDELEISWDARLVPQRPETVEFLHTTGTSRLALADVAQPLFEVITEASVYLASRHESSERFKVLVENVGNLKSVREDRVAWLLALGTTLDDMRQALGPIREFAASLSVRARRVIFGEEEASSLYVRPFSAALMFGAVSPQVGTTDRIRLLQSLAEAVDENEYPVDLLATAAPVDVDRSWEQGYRLAEQFLAEHVTDTAAPDAVDIEAILGTLGVTIGEISLDDSHIRAVAIAGPDYRPTVLLNREHQNNGHVRGRRFSLAHELCHLLFDRAFAREIAFASGPWAPRDVERRANAFAAMLLMPPDRVAQLVASSPHRLGSRELALEVAGRLHTGYRAVVEHMCNLSFIADYDRDALLDDTDGR